jgi:hypothetical protein
LQRHYHLQRQCERGRFLSPSFFSFIVVGSVNVSVMNSRLAVVLSAIVVDSVNVSVIDSRLAAFAVSSSSTASMSA